jgi:hypothetical protein
MQQIVALQATNDALLAQLDQQHSPSVTAGAVPCAIPVDPVTGVASHGKCAYSSILALYLFFTQQISFPLSSMKMLQNMIAIAKATTTAAVVATASVARTLPSRPLLKKERMNGERRRAVGEDEKF